MKEASSKDELPFPHKPTVPLQVFTNLGVQECGEFMRGSDPLRPMGHCIGVVYRSWAFLQRQVMERCLG